MNEADQFTLRVLRVLVKYDILDDAFADLDDDGTVRFAANCNDLFWWATADEERITPENIDLLEKACEDITEFCEKYNEGRDLNGLVFPSCHAMSLFACRARKMRPQIPCYKKWPAEVAALYDACGPERNNEAATPQKGTQSDEN